MTNEQHRRTCKKDCTGHGRTAPDGGGGSRGIFTHEVFRESLQRRAVETRQSPVPSPKGYAHGTQRQAAQLGTGGEGHAPEGGHRRREQQSALRAGA